MPMVGPWDCPTTGVKLSQLDVMMSLNPERVGEKRNSWICQVYDGQMDPTLI